MKRPILFSTGNIWQLNKSIYKQIESSLELNVDGIELLFPTATKLINFSLKKEYIDKFKKFKFNTIHMPFYKDSKKTKIKYYDTHYYRKLFEKAVKIANKINAVNLNIHAHQLKNPKLIDGLNIDFTFENLEGQHHFKISDYQRVFRKNPDINMLLDVSHAVWTNQLESFVRIFKDKIKFIHLSGAKGPKDDHYLLHRFDHPNRKRLDIIKKLNCPVIIEAGREKGLTIDDFRKEIKYVRKWLNS